MTTEQDSLQNRLNVGGRLAASAARTPDLIAIAEPLKTPWDAIFSRGTPRWRTISFAELDRTSDTIAANLLRRGLKPGMKLVLMVRAGIDFIRLVYAVFKAGGVLVMIDPGMGLRQMLGCLADVKPDGFIAIPPVHAVRKIFASRFPEAVFNVTVGRRWFWGGSTLAELKKGVWQGSVVSPTRPDDPAAIIFTSGSTGPAKGVLYTHRIIDAQIDEIAERFEISPGGRDLAAFPFFGLFNAVHGTTTIIPDMNPTRPATVDPKKFLDAANQWQITQSFASPAVWNRVVRYAMEQDRTIPTLRRVMSAGAPFPVKLIGDFLTRIAPDGDIFTPYGATESLPVALIGGREILGETAEKTRLGRGVCVGKRFARIRWRIIPITDDPFPVMENIPELAAGEIGELVVTGPQVTQRYVTRTEANALSKITDADGVIWHRIGDVGWIDEQERFWFCGRKSHRVVSAQHGTFFSIPCESIFATHPQVARAALAGRLDSSPPGCRIPVMFIERVDGRVPGNSEADKAFRAEMVRLGGSHPLTENIREIRYLKTFPVDVRHNAKIDREALSRYRGFI